jgi:hypothetical protein
MWAISGPAVVGQASVGIMSDLDVVRVVALQALHKGRGHCSCEARVLAVHLPRPPPPRVPQDVDVGRKHVEGPAQHWAKVGSASHMSQPHVLMLLGCWRDHPHC